MGKLLSLRYFLIAVLVIASYAIFVFPVYTLNSFTKTPINYYQSLTQGFLGGQLSLPTPPAPALLKLPNPYDPKANAKFRLFDASLYNGKYYLYFGALPVITFYLPVKLITGYYPPNIFAVFLYISIGFLLNFLLLIKIKKDNFPNISALQLGFAGLLIGFANNSPFLCGAPRIYEVAIASAYCFMSIAVYYLYEVFNNKFNAKPVIIFSVCLSLTMAGRPHFALACLLLVPIVSAYFIRYAPANQLSKLLFALFIPFLGICALLAFYNYARFGSIFDFGNKYQLGLFDYRSSHLVESNFYQLLPFQLYNYFTRPWVSEFTQYVSPIAGPYYYEITAGMLTMVPLACFIVILPKLFLINFKNACSAPRQILWFLASTALFSFVIMLFLLVHPATAQRYESDYLPYFIICAIISLWFLQSYTAYPRLLLKMVKQFYFASGTVSILIGINLGLFPYRHVCWVLTPKLSGLLFWCISITALLIYAIIRTVKPLAAQSI
jgi:hypothetical protein